MLWIAVIAFMILLLSGMPIVFAMGLSSAVALFAGSDLSLMMVPQRMIGQIDSFALLAVPFFILAGEVMEKGGISRRLVQLAACAVGHLRGGLAMVCVLSSMIFAGMSGSTAADASAIGAILVPAMKKRGYEPGFVVSLQSAAATMGPIIPPSTLAIIYGSIANVSIGALLLAGFIPGIMMGAGLMIYAYIYSVRVGYPVEKRATVSESFKRLIESLWALLVPIIILGGIVSGVCTATESGAIAAIYSVFVGLCVYKELSFKDLPRLFLKAAVTTSLVMIVIAAAGIFSWIMASQDFPSFVESGLFAISKNPTIVLFLILGLMFFIGCFMEIISASIIMIPVLYPIAGQLGFDPIHFAMLIMITMALGAVTPPVGVTLYIVLGIGDVPLSEANKFIWPYIGVLLLVLFILALVPPLVTVVPKYFLK